MVLPPIVDMRLDDLDLDLARLKAGNESQNSAMWEKEDDVPLLEKRSKR